MFRAGLHNKVKPTSEERFYPTVEAQPITMMCNTLPPPSLHCIKILGLGEGKQVEPTGQVKQVRMAGGGPGVK